MTLFVFTQLYGLNQKTHERDRQIRNARQDRAKTHERDRQIRNARQDKEKAHERDRQIRNARQDKEKTHKPDRQIPNCPPIGPPIKSFLQIQLKTCNPYHK